MSNGETITIEVWRPDILILFNGVKPKIIVDGKEVGKIKHGESIFFETTPGEHEVEVKALTTHNYKGTFDLQKGTIVKVGTDLVGLYLETTTEKK